MEENFKVCVRNTRSNGKGKMTYILEIIEAHTKKLPQI